MINKTKLIVCLIVSFICIACLISSSMASQQRLINFQGRLTDQQGNPLDGTYDIIFSIYASATDMDPIWTEEHTNVSVSKGLVNVLLGSITSFDVPNKVTFDESRYLGITIDCDHNPHTEEPEMLPRQQIMPAIYAYNADKLDGYDSGEFLIKADGGTIDGGLNITGNVGIGTTSPGKKLHVNSGPGNAGILVESSDMNAGIYFQDDTTGGDNQVGVEARGVDLGLLTSGTEQVRIKSNGNVGIGTMIPNAKLDVNGSIRIRNGNQLELLTSNNSESGTFFAQDSTPNLVIRTSQGEVIAFQDGTTTNMFIDGSNGNIGIGTTSPSPEAKLDVAGTIKATRFKGDGSELSGIKDTYTTICWRAHNDCTPRNCLPGYHDGGVLCYRTDWINCGGCNHLCERLCYR